MRLVRAGLGIAGVLLIAATPPPVVSRKIDGILNVARAAMVADPARALALGRQGEAMARHDAGRIDGAVQLASAEVIEADALTRLQRLDQAEVALNDAIEVFRRTRAGYKRWGDIFIVRGAIYDGKGDLASALRDYQAAYSSYQKAGYARGQAAALLSIGALYGIATDYASALKYIVAASRVYHGEPALRLAVLANLAAALKDTGRYRDSAGRYEEALLIARGLKSPVLTARLLGADADTLLKSGEVAGAERALNEAFALTSNGDPLWRLQLVAIAAQAAYQRHEYARAAALIGERFAGVDLATTPMPFREAHQTAYLTYRAIGDTPLALAHLAALKRLDDQATRLATSANAALATARFDFANQELRLATLQRDDANRKAELERQRARTERLVFLIAGGAIAIVTALLALGVVTLRRSRDRVRAVAADLARTNGALEKALAARTEFLATTSHEIRTPLNGILGMTQVMLADAGLPRETRERIGVVHGAGVTMRALVDDILDVAKMERGKLTVEEAPFSLCATLAEAARLWEEAARAKGLAFALDLSGCPGTIVGDAARVRQIVFNLLSNALKFTVSGSIGLAATVAGDHYRLTVSDSGIGIDPDQREAIFDSFRQADAGTTRRFGGTGLGLTICRNLARAMGGDVAVADAAGGGSSFVVTLPLRLADDAAGAGGADAVVGGTIVVDANPIGRATLAALLGRREAGIVALASIDEAVAAVACGRVVVDQSALAPLADPAAAVTALRARGAAVIVLWKGEVPMSVAAAASRVVAKPVGGATLLAAVFDTQSYRSDDANLVRQAA